MADSKTPVPAPRQIEPPEPDPDDLPRRPKPPDAMDRVRAFRDRPAPETERAAVALLARTGPLVLDRVHYRLERDRVVAGPSRRTDQEVKSDVDGPASLRPGAPPPARE